MSFDNQENFTDDDLGMGMNNGNNDMYHISDSDSEKSSNVGGRIDNYPEPPRRPNIDDDEKSEFSGNSEKSVSSYAGSDLTPEEEDRKKKTLLHKLKRLQKRGYPLSRTYTIESPLEDIQSELESIRREVNLDQGTGAAKTGLMFLTQMIEWANKKYDPVDAVLDGWSGQVQEDIDNGMYDLVMEDLYDKYYDRVNLSPEATLLMLLGQSAVTYHTSKTLISSAIGEVEATKLLKENPQLKANIMNAVNKSEIGQKINSHMGIPMKQQNEMKEPEDIDDILAEIENVDNNANATNNILNEKPGVVSIDGW